MRHNEFIRLAFVLMVFASGLLIVAADGHRVPVGVWVVLAVVMAVAAIAFGIVDCDLSSSTCWDF